MRTFVQLIVISFIIILSSPLTFCQDYSWQKVNPWRLDNVHVGFNSSNNVYFYDKEALYLYDDDNIIDTILLDFDLDISRLLFRSNDDIVITAVGTDFNTYSFISSDLGDSFEVFDSEVNYSKYLETENGMIREKRDPDSIFLYFLGDYMGEEKVFSIADTQGYELMIIDSTIFVFIKNIVLYSTDNGTEWDTLTFDPHIYDVTVNNLGGYSFSGSSWEIFNFNSEMEFVDIIQFEGMELAGIKLIYSVEFFDSAIYVSSLFTLFKSVDGGITWENIVDRPRRYQRGYVDFVKLSEEKMYFFSEYRHEILDVSTDDFFAIGNLYLDIISDVIILNDTTYYMTNLQLRSSTAELWKSTNKGVQWTFVRTILISDTSNIYYLAMDFIDEFNGVYVHPDSDGIMKTNNTGESWLAMSISPVSDPQLIEYVGEDSLFLCNLDSCYFTVDGGENWTKMDTDVDGQSYRWDLYEIDKNTYWIYGVDKLADSLTILKVKDFEVIARFSSPYEVDWGDIRFDGLLNGNLVYSNYDRIIELDWETMDTSSICIGDPEKVLLTAHNKDSMMIIQNDSLFLMNQTCSPDEGILYHINKNSDPSFSYLKNYFDERFEGIMYADNLIWKYTEEIDKSIFVDVKKEYIQPDDRQSLSYVSVYPNPTDGLLYIPDAYKKSKKYIIDMMGNSLLITEDEVLDLSDYSSGLYVIEFIVDNKRKGVAKVVVY